jgi:hypothetical protein
MRFEGAANQLSANQLAIDSHSAKINPVGLVADEIGIWYF